MKKKVVFLSTLLAAITVCLWVIVLHCAGLDIRIVQSNKDIGIPSPDNRYYLVEMSDSTGQYLIYSVIQINNPEAGNYYPATVYVTDDFWYHSRFIEGYGWIEGTHDFYIDSSDSGRHRYSFDGETWTLGN